MIEVSFTPCPDIGYHHILDWRIHLALLAVASIPPRPLRPWHYFPRDDWSRS